MNGMSASCAYATGVLLALTIAANAMDGIAPENRSAAARERGTLIMAQAQQSAPSKVFRGVGVITAIETATGSLTINHETIEGLMPAMEMMFAVNPRALSDGVRPGDEVEFSVDGKTYTILDLKVVGHVQ